MKNYSTFLIILFIFILHLLNISSTFAQYKWNRKEVGSAKVNNLIIANGRNDGVMRIYGATFQGEIYEWTYNKETTYWDKTMCAVITEDPNGHGRVFYSLQAGEGHNDNKTILYAANNNGFFYELFYNENTKEWELTKMNTGGYYQPQGIIIGDSRNDETNRIITCGLSFNQTISLKLQEYKWNNAEDIYDLFYIKDEYCFLFQGALGNARNNGNNYVYLPDYNSKSILEYEWTGERYKENQIALPSTIQRLAIGDARNDGTIRIYSSDGFYNPGTSYIRELTYNDNAWNTENIHSSYCPQYARHELAIGAARIDDNKKRLYSTARNGALVEHTFEDSKWNSENIDAISGATATIDIGNARNDDTTRIYVSGNCGKIYEYSHLKYTPTTTSIKNPDQESSLIYNFPNPCTVETTLKFWLVKKSNVFLTIFDNSGSLVYINTFSNLSKGEKEITINCSDFASGTYYYSLFDDNIKIGSNTLVVSE